MLLHVRSYRVMFHRMTLVCLSCFLFALISASPPSLQGALYNDKSVSSHLLFYSGANSTATTVMNEFIEMFIKYLRL